MKERIWYINHCFLLADHLGGRSLYYRILNVFYSMSNQLLCHCAEVPTLRTKPVEVKSLCHETSTISIQGPTDVIVNRYRRPIHQHDGEIRTSSCHQWQDFQDDQDGSDDRYLRRRSREALWELFGVQLQNSWGIRSCQCLMLQVEVLPGICGMISIKKHLLLWITTNRIGRSKNTTDPSLQQCERT